MPLPFLARSFLQDRITFLALFQSHWTGNRALNWKGHRADRANGRVSLRMGRGRPRPRVLSVRRCFTGTSRPRPCSLTFLNSYSRRRQGVFENGSRRRKEADFGAKNTSASLPSKAATALGMILGLPLTPMAGCVHEFRRRNADSLVRVFPKVLTDHRADMAVRAPS